MTKIIQITDAHLGVNADFRLAGVDTLSTFKAVIDAAKSEEFELILATGDLAQEASAKAYTTFFELIKTLGAPVYWLPGNHDLMAVACKDLNAPEYLGYFKVGNWGIIMLDSVIEHNPNGRLGPEELAKLARLLEENTQPNVLVCLHHQPIPVGSAWIDHQMISDSEQFLELVESDPAVRGVLWGHVHQDFSVMRGDRLFFASPSTSIQFKANSDDFALDDLYPGYRMLELKDDGSIETEVKRVELEVYGVDTDCAGY